MKRSGFKMRSGNGPLAFKLMGSSPVKQEYQAVAGTLDADDLLPDVEVSGKKNIADIFKKVDRTEKPIYKPRNKQVVNKNQEVSSSDQVKKPGIDTQLVEYVRRKIDERKNKNKIKKEEKNQAKLNSSNNSTEKGSKVEKTDERGATDKEINSDTVHPSQVESTDIEEKTDTEVDTGEKKKGWKFDIDWNEVATNTVGAIVTTGIKAGVEALGGNKKSIRKGGSISGFASQKFSSGSNLFAKKSDDT
jgi:sRNA-binding protein